MQALDLVDMLKLEEELLKVKDSEVCVAELISIYLSIYLSMLNGLISPSLTVLRGYFL